jgi:hypothetical protein
MTGTTYTIRTRTDVVGTVTSWDDAIALAGGYWGMTPSVRAAEDASRYTITVFGDYVGDLIVSAPVRDWSVLATGGTFVSGGAL